MKYLSKPVYCEELHEMINATITYLDDNEGGYIKGIAKGCIYQTKFNCNMKLCPISVTQDEFPEKL